jgi:hypothetical protein
MVGAVTICPLASTGWTTSRYTIPCLVGTVYVLVSSPYAADALGAPTTSSRNAPAAAARHLRIQDLCRSGPDSKRGAARGMGS